ncbi:hypothetical protein [Amycolatopsis sp. NPDC059657]|uniref:hypothetical protein n=1 Tax=Amycolatopsis sp. NPDC059657 TaxID=3346899 RepID=UPI003671013E
MARQPTPIGTWGNINCKQKPSGKWRAEAYLRMGDGTSKRVEKTGDTKTKAINALKKRLSELVDEIKAGEINADTRMRVIAYAWLEWLEADYRLSGKSMDTVRQFRGYVKNWVVKSIGERTARECRSAKPYNDLIQRCREQRSYDAAKSLRTVLSLICEYAIKCEALEVNPVKSTQRLSRAVDKKPEIKSLDAAQRADLIVKLEAFGKARQTDKRGRRIGRKALVWTQLPDLVDCMLATGVRVGELLALAGPDVIISKDTVKLNIGHHIVVEPGTGVRRMPGRKGNRPALVIQVPQWSWSIWRRLKLAAGVGPLFPAFGAEWLAPATMINRIKEAFTEVGYGWVTSHVFRKTVTAVLDEAGLSNKEIADQLGNTERVVEQHYRPKRPENPRTLAALEGMKREQAG